MAINAQLLRQLGKLGLDSQHPPKIPEQWEAFLEIVSGTYADSQQTVYLLERSMSISAREMSELNKMFENAQHIMLMSHWNYEKITKRMVCLKK